MINQMVLSREIEWIGYEPTCRMLQVEFIEGSIYQYQDVTQDVYERFLRTQSYGRFLEDHIKGKYTYRKVR